MAKQLVLLIAWIVCLSACQNASNPQQPDKKDASTKAATVLQLDGLDRIELFFYPDPQDRKNVQQLEITDTAILSTFRNNVLEDTITQAECPHDVKMFLIRDGEVFKTVYGATADSCNYLAYAINAKPFYTPLHQRAKALLDSLRHVAR